MNQTCDKTYDAMTLIRWKVEDVISDQQRSMKLPDGVNRIFEKYLQWYREAWCSIRKHQLHIHPSAAAAAMHALLHDMCDLIDDMDKYGAAYDDSTLEYMQADCERTRGLCQNMIESYVHDMDFICDPDEHEEIEAAVRRAIDILEGMDRQNQQILVSRYLDDLRNIDNKMLSDPKKEMTLHEDLILIMIAHQARDIDTDIRYPLYTAAQEYFVIHAENDMIGNRHRGEEPRKEASYYNADDEMFREMRGGDEN